MLIKQEKKTETETPFKWNGNENLIGMKLKCDAAGNPDWNSYFSLYQAPWSRGVTIINSKK